MPAKVLGLARLHRKIRKLPKETKRRVKLAMSRKADDIVEMMKDLAAEDTGALIESIGWTWGKAPPGALTLATITGLANDLTITIYAGNDEVFWARWVEFGTKAGVLGTRTTNASGRNRKVARSHPGTPAQPFFFVSWRAHRRDVRNELRKASREAARAVARR